MEMLLVGAGGFVGAILRYLVYLGEKTFAAHQFPYGTLVINTLGCFAAGVLLAIVERDFPSHRQHILFISIGIIGSFTTFSTFSVETFQLIRQDAIFPALISVVANITLGLAAVWAGHFLFRQS